MSKMTTACFSALSKPTDTTLPKGMNRVYNFRTADPTKSRYDVLRHLEVMYELKKGLKDSVRYWLIDK